MEPWYEIIYGVIGVSNSAIVLPMTFSDLQEHVSFSIAACSNSSKLISDIIA